MANYTVALTDAEILKFQTLYRGSLIPLHACLVGLTWGFHDYFVTLEDEIKYIWPQKRSFGKFMFLWIRYYTLTLLLFDVTQIHLFSRPGITNDTVCVAMDSIIRVVSAISLWSIEIIMQLRVYALYKCSRKVAAFNAILFLGSIGAFLWVLIHNALRRHAVIAEAIHLPLPGCPSIHSGIEWVQWIPATAFEGVLFGFALYKTLQSVSSKDTILTRYSLYHLLLRDNVLYFFGISCLLVFNNLMVVGVTKIPWFSYSPFHAAMGIMTTRMLLGLRKMTASDVHSGPLPTAGNTNFTSPQQTGSKELSSQLLGDWNAARGPANTFSSTGTAVGMSSSGTVVGGQSARNDAKGPGQNSVRSYWA